MQISKSSKRSLKSTGTNLLIIIVWCLAGCVLLVASPVLGGPCPTGDIDDDCQVDIDDLALMASQWLDSGPISANLDGFGEVGLADFAILAGDWGKIELTGSVTVMISGTVPTGGQWRVDSSSWHNSGDTASGIAVGSHTITFADVAGFDKPVDEPVTITDGGTAEVNAGAYIQHTGTLVVNISPQDAINDGAQWRVDGGTWYNSGSVAAQGVGTHTVEFSSVGSWQKPGSVQTEVFKDAQAVVNRSYVSIQSVTLQITEFMADNDSRSMLGVLGTGNILDGDLMSSDWIEIYNNSGSSIGLAGKYLTDEADQKTKWQFPAGMPQLQSGHYLIVFASGKTQEINPGNYPYWDGAYYHTNFQLDKGGEYLGLIDSDGLTVIHEYDKYPDQEENFSYGLDNGDTRYFSTATPGEANTGEFVAFVAKPDVNIEGGCYENAIDVTLSCDTVGASIRYTTDGSAPTLTHGTDYTGPIHIDSLTALVAKGFKTDFQPSKGRIETYIFVDPAVSPSNSNLPIVVVDTLGESIPKEYYTYDGKQYPLEVWIDCRAIIVDVDDVTGRANITGPEHFTGIGQIKSRGESTFGQGHYGLEILDEYGQGKDVSLLGMPAESDWILSYDVIDYSMMKNEIAFKWFRDMGHYAPRQRYVALYLNQDGGAISSGDYKGLFMLRERIKRNDDRVDIERLDALHNAEPQVSGGYIVKCDKLNPLSDTLLTDYLEPGNYGIHWTGNGKPILVEPKPTEVTQDQIDWITDYINEFHSVLWQNTGSIYYPGPQAKYTDYIDVTSWVDHFIVEQTCADSDAFWGSYYTHRDRNGKVHSGPTWDFDRSFHNNGSTYNEDADTIWRQNTAIFGSWHLKLDDYLEYRMTLADRWFQHRETVLNTAQTMAYIDQTIALIAEVRSIPKKTYPNTFEVENNLFKTWITIRLSHLDDEFASRYAAKPPILNPVGGYITSSDTIGMSLPSGASGDIYYTVNGEDPRLEGGGLNPNAPVYTGGGGPITETRSVTMVPEDAAKAVLVPTGDIGTDWTGSAEPYSDGGWTHGIPTISGKTGGVGYDEASTYLPYITYDLKSLMNDTMETCYIRIPFTADADDVADATDMTLRIRYDDGFRAYLNGTEIAAHNEPSLESWDTGASAQHGDTEAVNFIDFDCSAYLGSLQTGDNILAIRGYNRGAGSSDFLISAELVVDAETIIPGTGDITFNKSTCVKARIKDGSNWSAMNTEVYAFGPVAQNLRITELMYHPTDPTPAEITATGNPNLIAEDFEFIELKNIGGVPINLNLVHFTDGIDFTFGDYTLAAGEYAVLVKDQVAFAARYNTAGIHVVPGNYLGFLNNDGEEIVLRDAVGTEIHDFDYNDGWYELTDGKGYSLTLVDPNNPDLTVWDTKPGWRSSLYAGGTPGRAPEMVLAADSIVINEVLAHSHAGDPDWIELYNKTGNPIDISGWFLTDDDSSDTNIRKYEFQASSIVPAYGYWVLVQNISFGNIAAAGCHIPFGLSEGGETVYLYSGAGGGVTGFYQTQQKFDASETDVTFGRYEKAELSGGYDFVRQSSPSKNGANNGPLIPDIVITEIYYNPPLGADYEFVELYNRSGSAVTLETSVTTETSPGVFKTEDIPWRLEGTGYEFPADANAVTIPSHSYILVAKNPAMYSSAPCPVYGPYDGKLDNGGEEIEIQIPGDQEYGQSRYWIPIEKVDYDDVAPWPTSADGGGNSLNRNNMNAYSRDYSNWNAATPTPGF